jgi:hypothetical protein
MALAKDSEGFGVVRAIALTEGGNLAAVDPATGYGAPATGERLPPLAQKVERRRPSGRPRLTSALRPETRRAFREGWQIAKRAAARLVTAAEDDDPMTRLTAADELDGALSRLWDLREARDINWQAILNHTQGMLKQFFADKQVETLRPEQCRPIREIVEGYLGPSTKTADELVEVIRLIEDAGADPFGAISGDPDENPAA